MITETILDQRPVSLLFAGAILLLFVVREIGSRGVGLRAEHEGVRAGPGSLKARGR
jgi:hypothetical protein